MSISNLGGVLVGVAGDAAQLPSMGVASIRETSIGLVGANLDALFSVPFSGE